MGIPFPFTNQKIDLFSIFPHSTLLFFAFLPAIIEKMMN